MRWPRRRARTHGEPNIWSSGLSGQGLRRRSAFLQVALLSVASCGWLVVEGEVRMVRLPARALREEGRGRWPGAAAAVDGGSCGRRRGACPCLGSGRGCGPGWRGRPLLGLPRTGRCQCEHDENSGDEQLGAPDGRSHDLMPASRTCLVQAKLPEPAGPGAVLVVCRPSRCTTIRRLRWRRARPLSGAGWHGRAGSRRGRTSCRR